MPRSWQWISGIVIVLSLILGARVWVIQGLYLRSDIRASARDMGTVVQFFRETKGWSASDLHWQSIVCRDESCVYQVQYTYHSRDWHPETETVFIKVNAGKPELISPIYEK